jgi:hypothetical protein
VANLGGGGGGGDNRTSTPGCAGGSGVVILSYPTYVATAPLPYNRIITMDW